MKKLIILFAVALSLSSCNDFLKVDPDNVWAEENIQANPIRAEGILLKAYAAIPGDSAREDIATDDAVTNNFGSGMLKAATGSWASNNDPFGKWNNSYEAIQYVNLFLDKYVDVVQWYEDPSVNEECRKRLKGEAYALRAWYYYSILRKHAGVGKSSGQYMGFPIVDKFYSTIKTTPRATFAESVKFILDDIERAEALLPADYADKEGDYDYNRVYGKAFGQRMSGDIVAMLRAKVLLLAASPAFADAVDESGTPVATWEQAARAAGNLIKKNGGLSLLKDGRCTFYIYDEDNRKVHEDMVWRKSVSNDKKYDTEQKYFPPSLYGNGEINPTLDLVNAFPDKNGYPITHASTVYSKTSPYKDRDPRLAQYIICNGDKLKGSSINTLTGTQDGIGKTEKSTRTGFYLKKHTNENVTLNPSGPQGAYHFFPLMRYTELFLIYAEAANQAWGPKSDPNSFGFTAYDVMIKLRQTAGFASTSYVDEVAVSKDAMNKFIRNERRIELCFEGFRFWDLRRWKETDKMKESATGLLPDGKTTDVEIRAYSDYMIYGPVPYKDARLGIEQNIGWN